MGIFNGDEEPQIKKIYSQDPNKTKYLKNILIMRLKQRLIL